MLVAMPVIGLGATWLVRYLFIYRVLGIDISRGHRWLEFSVLGSFFLVVGLLTFFFGIYAIASRPKQRVMKGCLVPLFRIPCDAPERSDDENGG